MMKSQTIPIQAAFHDIPIATTIVAIGPIRKPATQSRSTVTNHLTPVSLHQLALQGMIQHRGFRNRALDLLQT